MQELERELEIYKENLSQLLKDEGKYVLIFKDDIVGIYSAYDDALKAGYDTAELEPFLVKKISGTETVAYFTRELSDTHHTPPQ